MIYDVDTVACDQHEMISSVNLTPSVTFISTHKKQLRYDLTVLFRSFSVETIKSSRHLNGNQSDLCVSVQRGDDRGWKQ